MKAPWLYMYIIIIFPNKNRFIMNLFNKKDLREKQLKDSSSKVYRFIIMIFS